MRKLPKGLAFLAISIIYVPLITVLIDSFRQRDWEGRSHWTFAGYQQLTANREILEALYRSLLLATSTAFLSTLFGTLAALFLTRTEFPGKKGVEGFLYLPLVMPELVLGLALLIWFMFLGIPLGFFSVLLAHLAFTLSYVIMTVQARLQLFDRSLEEAARDLGANSWRAFWEVTLPLIRPGILSGGVMAFTLSLDDFLITFFTMGVSQETLPLRIYSMMKYGTTPEMSALATLFIVGTALLVWFFQPQENSA